MVSRVLLRNIGIVLIFLGIMFVMDVCFPEPRTGREGEVKSGGGAVIFIGDTDRNRYRQGVGGDCADYRNHTVYCIFLVEGRI